jgi:hypothetical protein
MPILSSFLAAALPIEHNFSYSLYSSYSYTYSYGNSDGSPILPGCLVRDCPAELWGTGQCDEACNTAACLFDGRDCLHGSEQPHWTQCADGDAAHPTGLGCPGNLTITHISFASFGTPSGRCTGAGADAAATNTTGVNASKAAAPWLSIGACHHPETQEALEMWCLGLPACTLPPLTSDVILGGDPCPEVARKRLVATAICGDRKDLRKAMHAMRDKHERHPASTIAELQEALLAGNLSFTSLAVGLEGVAPGMVALAAALASLAGCCAIVALMFAWARLRRLQARYNRLYSEQCAVSQASMVSQGNGAPLPWLAQNTEQGQELQVKSSGSV